MKIGGVENIKLDLPSAKEKLALFVFWSKFRRNLEVTR